MKARPPVIALSWLAILALAGGLPVAASPRAASSSKAPSKKPPRDEPADPHDPGCIYGKVLDGHSGAIRCLSPEEIAPPTPYDTPATGPTSLDGGAPADAGGEARLTRRDAAAEAAATPLSAVSVSIESLTFENGEVPHAEASLNRLRKDFARCVATDSSLRAGDGAATITLRFIVRAPGRAEGVDVTQSRGVSADIVRCVVSSLVHRPVGAPSSDPVGVELTVRMRKD